MNPPAKITTFDKGHRFLSNFYRKPFVWAGRQWPTAEHAYQAAKATGADTNIWVDKIHACKTPGDAKRMGRKVPLRAKWQQIKVEIMRRIVTQKFVQNPELLRRLLETGDAILEEGNSWNDNFWGMCPPGNSDGENWLGKILMEIREEFRGFTNLPLLAERSTFDQADLLEEDQ